MPATEIITIINNSGKVISTGKQLVSIFKEAKAAYREKRETIRAERGIQRSRTFDVTPRGIVEEYDEYEEEEYVYERRAIRDVPDRRRSHDDSSQASSHRSHRSRRTHHRESPPRPARPALALTEANLRTHSEVSATPPSAAPRSNTYRAPYAETAPRDMQLSRPNLAHAATMPMPATRADVIPSNTTTPVSTPRQSMLVHRPRSDGSLQKKKEIDMDLAYGNVPPDLAHRTDLDKSHPTATTTAAPGGGPEAGPVQEKEAMTMIHRIESLLEEAECVQHTASSMIAHLQENPQAAAAVALTLAELSALVGKMSPAFLGVIKGSSPAIFALLASPQFLIGTSIALGVTVVVFGGWKIVKRLREAKEQRKMEGAFEMQNVEVETKGGADGSYEEALVLEEELSTIETWRRGIQPFGVDADDEESADVELISPAAERELRRGDRDFDDEVDPDDSVSRSGRSMRSHRTSRTHRSRRHRGERRDDVEVPERKSSRRYEKDGGVSEVAESERSHRSHRSSRRSDDGHSSSRSKRGARSEVKAIEEGKEEEEEVKPKKNNMLKQLFKKKKEKEEKEKAVSVLV
ncbi:hypothetical protein QBC47DRAFT_117804 [Echria macrotheca]|uniref:Uncharacterized protein n=1 Tax=Echria macrotheca TaxID=438768 RepID=A0AAJ0BMK5_9PEZI|nr:hypothetical protein QBC47DRAFT_117804 [Echria macrotheca]